MRRWQKATTSPNTVFSINASGPGEWLAGTNEGLWRYADRACEPAAEPLKNTALTAVAAGNGIWLVGAADGIAYSTDGGASWTAGAMPQPAQIGQIALSPNFAVDGIAFAATTNQGVLRTTDSGVSWRYRSLGLADAEVTALALSPTFQADITLFAGVMNGLFMSVNLGETWRLSPLERAAAPLSGIAFARNGLVAGSESRGLYHSTNRGAAWSKRSAFVSGPISALAVSQDATKIALATPMVVATSSDFGETWERAEGKAPRDVIALCIDDDGTILCGTQQDGLWVY
jgi:photosystem II stability/assembly factor-like uncharacterized protein